MLMSFGIVRNPGLARFRKAAGLSFPSSFRGGLLYSYPGVPVNYRCKCYIVSHLIIDRHMVGRKLF